MSKRRKPNSFPITCPPFGEESTIIASGSGRRAGLALPAVSTGATDAAEAVEPAVALQTAASSGGLVNPADGSVYIDVGLGGTGADYAGLFETESGQPIEPGYFVTFAGTGDRVRIAQAYDEYVLGVVSRAPGFVAGGGERRWKNKFQTDEWGSIVYEDVTVPHRTDARGIVLASAHAETRPALNPSYDPTRAYVPREQRPEWVKVGLLGRLLVRDDGTLTSGGYCRPGMNGIAVASHAGYRVLRRTGPNQVMILFR